MKYIRLFTLTLFTALIACTVHREGFKKSETIKVGSVKTITYLHKTDTIFLTRDSSIIQNVIDFVNLGKRDSQSRDFKSYRFLILEFADHSKIRIEAFEKYFKTNREIFKSKIDIDSVLTEYSTEKRTKFTVK